MEEKRIPGIMAITRIRTHFCSLVVGGKGDDRSRFVFSFPRVAVYQQAQDDGMMLEKDMKEMQCCER